MCGNACMDVRGVLPCGPKRTASPLTQPRGHPDAMMRPSYALVTGASTGLGRFFAQALAARQQNLILVARASDKLTALADKLKTTHGVSVEPLAFDLSDAGAGQRL